MISYIKKFNYTFLSNLLSTSITFLITLIIPRIIGTHEYGYFQLYLLYTGYASFLHLGSVDGIFLRYGGEYYEQLNYAKMKGQFCFLFGYSLIIVSLFFGYGWKSISDERVVIFFVGIAAFLILQKLFFQYILQATSRMKEYAYIILIEKLVFVVLFLIEMWLGNMSIFHIIVFDLVGKCLGLLYGIFQCRAIILSKSERYLFAIKEFATNIKVGYKLTLSTLSALLITGIVRIGIERAWGVSTFGKVSLTLSLSNILMLLINAVSIVLFPSLRRISEERYSNIYMTLRNTLVIPLLGMLLFSYPLKYILEIWLPQYKDGLQYMPMLFPICIYESKNSMLSSTFLKTMRQEGKMLFINIIFVFFSILSTAMTTVWQKDLNAAVLSIVILLGGRATLSEIVITRILGIKIGKRILQESLLIAFFIFLNWMGSSIWHMILYIAIYFLFLFRQRYEIKNIMERFIKNQF